MKICSEISRYEFVHSNGETLTVIIVLIASNIYQIDASLNILKTEPLDIFDNQNIKISDIISNGAGYLLSAIKSDERNPDCIFRTSINQLDRNLQTVGSNEIDCAEFDLFAIGINGLYNIEEDKKLAYGFNRKASGGFIFSTMYLDDELNIK